MKYHLVAMLALSATGAIYPSLATRSQNILERLISPGPLFQGHVKFESTCKKCHEAFSRRSQSRLCLDCHKDIASDRRLGTKLHGRQPEASKLDCNHCHTDHRGRKAKIAPLDRETFNHAFTNFKLEGAHATKRCDGCHISSVKFRRTPTKCFDCHKKLDRHKARLGQKCEKCHSEISWRSVKPFDHSRTKFALIGAHTKVACVGCHGGEIYSNVSAKCIGCHALRDIHSKRYGEKCESCHDQSKWKTIGFDHSKTKYPLRGKHATIKCDACHPGDLYRDKLATSCVSCHKKQDPHKLKLGPRCETCHGESSWRREVAFDHDITQFPLIGRHAIVPCEECHRSQTFKNAPKTCVRCHVDKHHEGRLGSGCGNCHNPNGWRRWRFNHDTQTKYALTGAHRGLHCHACHKTKHASKVITPTICYDCHKQDDVHQDSFGRSCERCHTTASFKSFKR